MTTQPLTPENVSIIVVAPSAGVLEQALLQYGIPTDAGNVEPTLAVARVSTLAECKTLIDTAPPTTRPWALISVGWPFPSNELRDIIDSMRTYFGQEQTLSSAIRAMNNEYAIDPKRFNG